MCTHQRRMRYFHLNSEYINLTAPQTMSAMVLKRKLEPNDVSQESSHTSRYAICIKQPALTIHTAQVSVSVLLLTVNQIYSDQKNESWTWHTDYNWAMLSMYIPVKLRLLDCENICNSSHLCFYKTTWKPPTPYSTYNHHRKQAYVHKWNTFLPA